MENYQANIDPELFITTSLAKSITVTVTSPKYSSPSISQSFTITRGQVQKVVINKALKAVGSGKSTKAILVSATDEVVVYGVNKEGSSTDGYLALPTDVIGTSYYLTTMAPPSDYPSELMVVGVEDGTSITIRFGPNTGLNVTYNAQNYYKNDQLTISLNSYECFQLQSRYDLTGTYVTSTKVVSMFSGNALVNVGGHAGTRDMLTEQHVPTNRWGKKFAIIPTPTRLVGDTYQFIASEYSTTISVTASNNGASFSETISIQNAGQWGSENLRTKILWVHIGRQAHLCHALYAHRR